MKRVFPFVFSLLIFLSCHPLSNKESSTNSSPNIILIIADDMAWNDCTVYGHPSIQTPHLQRMANEGMRFDQAFLTTSSCSPSRSSIITGRYPHQTDAEQLHWPLPGEQITFVEKLKAAGYWTAQAGKWHLGSEVKDRFDIVVEQRQKAIEVLYNGDESSAPLRDGSGCEDWEQLLDMRPKEKPFFMWLAASDPHRGYQPNAIPNPHTAEDIQIPPYMADTPEARADFALYYDEVSRLDSYVGKVLDKLVEQGVDENTLVLFISDNGRPFPRDKTTLYDGGIKTPWIMRWPVQIQAGSSSDQLVSAVDIASTFLSIAGVQIGDSFQGKDISPLFNQANRSIRDYIYAEDHWHDFDDYTRAVRSTQFKYIRNFYPENPNTPPADALGGGTFQSMRKLRNEGKLTEAQMLIFNSPRPEEEFFDILKDPNELHNLALLDEYQDTLTYYRKLLDNFRTETNDTLPPERTPDEFDPETGASLPSRKIPRLSKKERWGE